MENPKTTDLLTPIFFGRRYDGMKGFPADFRPENRYSAGDHDNFFSFLPKKSIFSIFPKVVQKQCKYRILLKKHFKHHQRPISAHIPSYKSIQTLRKKKFFYENHDFLRFLNFDDAIDYSAGNGSSGPPRYFYIPCMLLYDHQNNF